jgi:hypothetical protein
MWEIALYPHPKDCVWLPKGRDRKKQIEGIKASIQTLVPVGLTIPSEQQRTEGRATLDVI